METLTQTAESFNLPQTNYRNGQKSLELVRSAIAQKFGEEEAKRFNPYTDARTFKAWIDIGYAPMKNEHGIRSFIMIPKKGTKKSEEILVPKNIWLFHRLQVQPIQ